MRTAAVLLLLSALLPGAAFADHQHLSVGSCDVKEPLGWGARHDLARARFAIVSEDRTSALLLTRDLVAVQLSDRALRDIDRDFAREKDKDEGNVIGDAIKGAVLGTVRALLDHSLECPVADLRDVRYRDGRLILITNHGDRLLEDLTINDQEVLEGFSEHDALAFVREFHRLKRDR